MNENNNDQNAGAGSGNSGDNGGDNSGSSNANNSNNANDANDQNAGGENQPVQLTEAQLAAAFNHPRFKELTQAANELKTLKESQEKAERERLEKQGEFKTLAEKAQAEAEQAREALKTERINNAVTLEAAKLGAHDPAVVAKLVDSGKLTMNDDGTITGADEALKALQSSNPYLFKTGSSTSIGGGDTNGQSQGGTDFKASQFQDAAFYKEHAKEMDAAMLAGRVDMNA